MTKNRVVYPIRDKKQIDTLKKYLHDNTRNHLLFVLGINTGIRMNDLLELRVGQVSNKEQGFKVLFKEGKTKKTNFFIINKEIHKSLVRHLDGKKLNPDDYLFLSRKGGRLRLDSVHKMIEGWCRDVGIVENVGSRTLRKTFGYHLYQSGVSVDVIQKRFNHSSSNITLRYIGIDEQKIEDTLNDFNL